MVKTRANSQRARNTAATQIKHTAATKIQKFVRKRIGHRFKVTPRPVIHHNPLVNPLLLSLIARHGKLPPTNLRALGNATRRPNNWEVQAMQNTNVQRRRRIAAEVARGRLPKIGPKPNYSIQMKMLRMIETARRHVANNNILRQSSPNLNRRLALLRNDILRKLNHRTTNQRHNHNINNTKFTRINVGSNNNNNNNRGFIHVRNVVVQRPSNMPNNGNNYRGGSVNFHGFTNNGRNVGMIMVDPRGRYD